jgi:competence protein ComEC
MKRKLLGFSAVFLCIANLCIWYAAYREDRGDLLSVYILDIGQGDAIFIQAPNGNQILIDAGPGNSVLSELREVMPIYDKSIDMIVITNPDADHIGGFVEVLKRYGVDTILQPGTISDSALSKELDRLYEHEHARMILARRGMRFIVDTNKKIYMDILFPDRDVSKLSTNDGSIVMRLVYGDTSFMLTGDSPEKIEKYLVSLEKTDIENQSLKSNVLKVGHHGSRTSTSYEFLSSVQPELAVISAGKNNKYKHPHKEVLDRLAKLKIPILGTYEHGRIEIRSDGKEIRVI